jgi:hypothetical protein
MKGVQLAGSTKKAPKTTKKATTESLRATMTLLTNELRRMPRTRIAVIRRIMTAAGRLTAAPSPPASAAGRPSPTLSSTPLKYPDHLIATAAVVTGTRGPRPAPSSSPRPPP